MGSLRIRSKPELAESAHTLAVSYEYVRFRGQTYIPQDYETGDTSVSPATERKAWKILSRQDIQLLGAHHSEILFSSESELSSYEFMIAQNAKLVSTQPKSLLVKTEGGLKVLQGSAELEDPSGSFIPNLLGPTLNTDEQDKAEVFQTISDWLNSDEEAESLLRHLATALAPDWSAVKYLLLLGEGRNGKSLLLRMMEKVFGAHNVSNVTRQQMSDASPVVTSLNGMLLNLVFDGAASFVKDSGNEKSLIAGEPVPIRKLYESSSTIVQTNALFIEGLNREPKSSDKSSALQKRLVRFHFTNVYKLDRSFERKMLSEKTLGAFLALLIDHYVEEDEVAEKLAPTSRALELHLEHMYANTLSLQFLKHYHENTTTGADDLIGMTTERLTEVFRSWRLQENDLSAWPEPDVMNQFAQIVTTKRKSIRDGGKVRKVRIIDGFKEEAIAFIDTLEGEEDDAEDLAALVAD